MNKVFLLKDAMEQFKLSCIKIIIERIRSANLSFKVSSTIVSRYFSEMDRFCEETFKGLKIFKMKKKKIARKLLIINPSTNPFICRPYQINILIKKKPI